MAKPYTITIKDGKGTEEILNGDYEITTLTKGYDALSIDPKTITIDDEHKSYDFKISAKGKLDIVVTEDGTTSGTPIVGATFVRCDKTGTAYGNPVVTDANGLATFMNVPFNTEGGILVYYKQTSSDENHNFDSTLKNAELQTETEQIIIINPKPSTKTINLTDTNYEGLPIKDSQINLT